MSKKKELNKIRDEWKKMILIDRHVIKKMTGINIRGFGYDNQKNK
jgi:hypothetical protein